MTSSEHSDVSDPNQTNRRVSSPISVKNMVSLTVFGCSIAALVISFLGLQRFDLPVTKYVRSVTVHLPWDQLTIPWMAFTSNAGDWIGQGWRLASVSLLLLAAAWAFNRPMLKLAAIQSLIAHGIAAVLANVLKHLIGRPRPKFRALGRLADGHLLDIGSGFVSVGAQYGEFRGCDRAGQAISPLGPAVYGIRGIRGTQSCPSRIAFSDRCGWRGGRGHSQRIDRCSSTQRVAYVSPARMSRCGDLGLAVLAVLWTLSHKMDDSVTGMLFMAVGVSAVMGGFMDSTDLLAIPGATKGNVVVEDLRLSDCVWARGDDDLTARACGGRIHLHGVLV